VVCNRNVLCSIVYTAELSVRGFVDTVVLPVRDLSSGFAVLDNLQDCSVILFTHFSSVLLQSFVNPISVSTTFLFS
jgi:hypothetical protein